MSLIIISTIILVLCREYVVVSTGTAEYTLAKEDVGRQLAFVYIPINFEGMFISILFVEYVKNLPRYT